MTHQTRCEECGWTSKPTTPGRAEYALRRHSCELTRKRRARAIRAARRKKASGPVRACWHKNVFHRHGTRNAYVCDGCRCRACRDASSAYERERTRLKLYGRPSPIELIDAEPVRKHIRALMAAGMGWKRVAQAAGIYPSSVYPILYGRGGSETRPTRIRIKRATADKLLAVQLDLADGALIDGTGTRRRLQALVALGWSRARLARRLDMLDGNFSKTLKSERVRAGTERAVRELYDELSMRPPEPVGHRAKISINRARRSARELGWAPPLAWDDDTIDDPAASPVGQLNIEDDVDTVAVERRAGGDRTVKLTKAERHELVRRLYAEGLNDVEIGWRSGYDARQILRDRHELGLPAQPRSERRTA